MSDQFIGEIRMFAGNFAPTQWATCSGQLLPIMQNTLLFSILGTTYGGNGATTFALPDLRNVAPSGVGTGPGLTPQDLGEQDGAAAVTIGLAEMTAHRHTPQGATAIGDQNSPSGATWAQPVSGRTAQSCYATAVDGTVLNTGAITALGGGQPHNNLPPYLVVMFIIALQGQLPPRTT